MKSSSSKLFLATVLSLGLVSVGATPAFAAKGLKAGSKVAATQKSTDGKSGKRHHRHHKHEKLTRQEKRAIKRETKKQLKKQSAAATKLSKTSK